MQPLSPYKIYDEIVFGDSRWSFINAAREMICFLGRARVPPLIMTREYFRHCGSCHLCVGTESDDDTDELSLEAYRHDAEMTPYAYYQWAVCEREREHIPLIGPSVDRRTLAWIVRIMKSENIESLICFACAQVRTHVAFWDKMHEKSSTDPDYGHLGHLSASEIKLHTVQASLLQMEASDTEAFQLNFCRNYYKDRYAQSDGVRNNPLENAAELQDGAYEWQRRLLHRGGSENALDILCCPEDVRRSETCKHASNELCKKCSIPLCSSCYAKIRRRGGDRGIPMALCNDNFWGYTTDIISRYQVRWIEAAIEPVLDEFHCVLHRG